METETNTLETAAAELRAGRHGSAERRLKRILRSRPRDPIARHLLGLVHLARGEFGPAAHQLRLAVDHGAGTDAKVNLALALVADEQHGEAEQVLRAAAEHAPTHVGAAFNLGHLLRIAGNPGEAEEWLRRALVLDDTHGAARLELGLALMETGALDEARQCLVDALGQVPESEVAAINIAHIDRRLGRFEAAAERYRSLREAGVDDSDVDLGHASCLQELGRQDDALGLFRTLLEREPALYPRVLRVFTDSSRGVLPFRPSAVRALLTGSRRL